MVSTRVAVSDCTRSKEEIWSQSEGQSGYRSKGDQATIQMCIEQSRYTLQGNDLEYNSYAIYLLY